VLPAGNPEGQRPFELWKTVEMAYREEHPEPLCCAKCTQCIDLRNTKGTIRVGNHHMVQVRVAILCEYETPDRYQRPYATFTHVVQNSVHKEPKDPTGLSPYWRRQTFYKTMYKEAERVLETTWPFDKLREAGVDYKLEPHTVTYAGYVDRDETKNCKVSTFTKQKVINNLPAPKHVQRHETYGTQEFDGEFTVFMTVTVDTIKAKSQQILYADDRLARRLKQIMTDNKAENNDLYCIGAILLAISAHKRDNEEDSERPKKPPYGKCSLKGSMDHQSWEDYNNVLNACRKRQSIRDVEKLIGEARKSTSDLTTSSTHGHQVDTPTTDVNHNGRKRTDTRYITGTKPKRPPTPYRDSRYSSGQLKKEKSWSGSTPTLIQPTPTKDHMPKDKPQKDGGRESSIAQRRSVFERLTMPKQPLQKKDNDLKKEKDKEHGNAKKPKTLK
jgi:hypothetical protein